MISAPVISDLSPASGSDGGGDKVVITGSGFTGATGVRFGNVPAAAYSVDSDTTIHALSPRAEVGMLAVPVTISSPAGESVSTDANQFVYRAVAGVWSTRHTVGLFAILVAIAIVGRFLPDQGSGLTLGAGRSIAWLATLILMLAFVMIAGQGITDRWDGLLIDERNRMSLARLQLLLWTVLIVSALLTIALANIARTPPNAPSFDALAIAVPGQIWTVLGISTASLVGSPLLLSNKATQTPQQEEQATTSAGVEQKDNLPSGSVQATGVLLTKSRPEFARWSDLFKGEETGNGDYLDASRVQMFFFTFVLVLAYGVAIFGSLVSATVPLAAFPQFDQSMVALLAISHAGYLTNKVIPHSQTSPT